MPRRRKTKEEMHTLLSIEVDSHQVCTSCGHNLNILGGRHFANEDEPVYRFDTRVEISGLCAYPEERTGERYDVILISAKDYSHALTMKVKDLREVDNNGMTRYKKLKNGMHPIYKKPPPVGYMDKVRGENRFTLWLWVAPQMVTDALITLSNYQFTFMSIHEIRADRKRQVHSFTIQTTDPAEE